MSALLPSLAAQFDRLPPALRDAHGLGAPRIAQAQRLDAVGRKRLEALRQRIEQGAHGAMRSLIQA